MFRSADEWRAAVERVAGDVADLRADVADGWRVTDGDDLAAVLERYERVMRDVEAVETYARLRRWANLHDEASRKRASRAGNLAREANRIDDLLRRAIREPPAEAIRRLVAETDRLERYAHYLDTVLREAPHARTAEVEAVIEAYEPVASAPRDVYGVLTSTEIGTATVALDGQEVALSGGTYVQLMRQGDRAVRRRAYERLRSKLGEYRTTLATLYKHHVQAAETRAAVRNYDSALAATLDADGVSRAAYDTVLTTVRDNLDLHYEHLAFKRRRLGLDRLRMWDRHVPTVDSEPPSVPYDRAIEYVVDAVAPLGETYRSTLADGLADGWVDAFPREGKRARAFSDRPYDGHPYVLVNYRDDLDSLYTLAHELGHAMHAELATGRQPYVYAAIPDFASEVASTVHEILLTRHLLAVLEDDRVRRHVLDRHVEMLRNRVFRHAMMALFERDAHAEVRARGVTFDDDLDETYEGLLAEFYAPVELDADAALGWLKVEHLFSSHQLYEYCVGISVALTVVDGVLDGSPDPYLAFLRAGTSEYPRSLLERVGVDLASPTPVETALERYEWLLDELVALEP